MEENAQDNVHGLGFRGVLLDMGGVNQSIPDNIETPISWGSAIYNTDGFWSADEPTKIKIPTGVKRVKLTAGIEWTSNTAGYRQVYIKRNGATVAGMPSTLSVPVSGTVTRQNIISAIGEPVSTSIYFELYVLQNSGVALNVNRYSATFFALEVIE